MDQELKLPFEKVKRRILIKSESKTDPSYGCDPNQRPVEELINYGVVNIDKPSGPTSHEVASYVRKILNIKRAGHSGTLDPKVTGVLPIALGRATRILQFLLKAGKEYIALMHIHKKVPEEEIKKTMNSFVGLIEQLPPKKSAVKRQVRKKHVYYIDILEIDGKDVLFRVGCQAGVYIRKLIHDVGVKLGSGAHMQELRRTKAGPFDETTLITLQDLLDAYWFWKNEGNEKYIRYCIKPIEFAVQHLPKVWVKDAAVDALCHGIDLKIPGVAKLHDYILEGVLVAVMTLKDELIAVGIAETTSEKILKKQKGYAVNIKKVFMQPGTYPKMKKTS